MTDFDSKPPISAFIRAHNEERLIGDVVRAALQVAQEVIVVDAGSTDKTAELARAAGAKVINHAWAGWGKQKRIGEDACSNDWLLDIDSDEIITPELAAEIRALFKDGEPKYDVYRTKLALAPPIGRPWINFGRQVRHKLYNRLKVRAPDHKSWDEFRIPADMPVGHVQAPLLHHSITGIEHLVRKINRSSTVRAQAKKMRPKWYIALRIVFGLPFYFSKRYFLQQYFRGGVYGFALALTYGYQRWLGDVKMWERLHGIEQRDKPPST